MGFPAAHERSNRTQLAGEGTPLVIVGAGGHGRVCADIAHNMRRCLVGFCDNHHPTGQCVNGVEVIAPDLATLKGRVPAHSVTVFIAVGDNGERRRLFEQAVALGYKLDTLIHPSAIVSPTALLGAGSVLMPGTIVNANAAIGENCIVNTAASLDHDATLGDVVQICPGVRVAGHVSIGGAAFVGTGAVVVPRVKIGARAVIGAGSVVMQDVVDDAFVVGVPAKPVWRAKGSPRTENPPLA